MKRKEYHSRLKNRVVYLSSFHKANKLSFYSFHVLTGSGVDLDQLVVVYE